MCTITIGVDLAKSAFSVCTVDAMGRVARRQDLNREAFALALAQMPAGSVVAMEACSGAHHWARRCLNHGLQPRLMAAHFVTPFRKRRTSKNDRHDAEAIATAARQGNMRFVPVKPVDQQARLHARQRWAMLAHDVDYDPDASLHHPMSQLRSTRDRAHETASPSEQHGSNGSDPPGKNLTNYPAVTRCSG